MYFDYVFLLTDFYKNGFIPDSFESTTVVIPVTKSLWEKKAYYFQRLYATPSTFCFGFFQKSLGGEHSELSWIRDSLSLFFFLPNYAKKAGAYLLVSDFDIGTGSEVMNHIEQLLKTQGIAPLSKNYTVQNSDISRLNEHYYYNKDVINSFGDDYTSIDFAPLFKILVAENGAAKKIVITVRDEEDFKRKSDTIKYFEQWVSNNQKTYADLLFEIKKTNEEYSKLKVINDKLRFSLDNFNDYLKALRKMALWYVNEYHRISREKPAAMLQDTSALPAIQQVVQPATSTVSEVYQELVNLRQNRDEILTWYTKEYEVLPLWYKRFGHLIKIATGKKKIKEYIHRQKKS